MLNENTDKVQLDGLAVRRIRETQKLTQFYIAKVVGVTTDTVSRWENNRYPTVRRDNAILLAEALEVAVEELLLKESSDEAVSNSRSSLLYYSVVATVLLLIAFGLYLFFYSSPVVNYLLSVQRLLPPHASVATQLPVRVLIDITGNIDGMVLRENFPRGYKLIEASPAPSSLDNVDGSVRWILPIVTSPVLVSYLLQPDSDVVAGDNLVFQGELIVNAKGENRRVVVQGDKSLLVDVYHWADANKDLIIDDGEALDASVTSIAMKNVHVDWDLIEEIWDAGSYRFDPETQKFIAVRKNDRD